MDDSRFIVKGVEKGMDTSQFWLDAISFDVLLKNEYVEETDFGAVLYFVSGTTNGSISEELDSYLDTVATRYVGKVIDIIGHTDNAGSEEENFLVALGSANTIKDILITKGFDSYTLNVSSKGRH